MNKALCLIVLLFLHSESRAQTVEASSTGTTSNVKKGVEFGISTGPFLVNGIAGVREILPVVGARLGLPFRQMHFETTILSGRSEGTEYHQADIGVRIDMDFDFIQYFLLLGADFHYWKREPSPFREFEYRSGQGWHTGFGFFYPVSPALSFRNDFKLNFGPGISMFVGLGFVFHFESGGDSNQSVQ